MFLDLQADLEKFENWLNEKEIYLDNLVVDRKWNLEDIEENLRVHKVNGCNFVVLLLFCFNIIIEKYFVLKSLQTDIESHARIINSVLKLSEKIKQISIDYSHFYDSGISLQERWHCLWLKSLEWQCRLEQKKKVSLKQFLFSFFFLLQEKKRDSIFEIFIFIIFCKFLLVYVKITLKYYFETIIINEYATYYG